MRADIIWDLARIMRVAGTVNLKTGSRSHFINLDTKKNIGLREMILASVVDITPRIIVPKQKTISSLEEAKQNDQKLAKILSSDLFGFVSRSEAEMSAVTRLVQFGFTDEEIDEIMDDHNMRKWKESGAAYKQHTINKAREWFEDEKLFKLKGRSSKE